ncbi:unnamed protein product [Prorocentrum cordatum]|uniref:Uncharacterized protein n=1 Tax=Prorocentrum cordatum TaxID=2364126 RepID=A0ABN9XY04_9DINO|nr:unnamed protein product [Polarella glacialis]
MVCQLAQRSACELAQRSDPIQGVLCFFLFDASTTRWRMCEDEFFERSGPNSQARIREEYQPIWRARTVPWYTALSTGITLQAWPSTTTWAVRGANQLFSTAQVRKQRSLIPDQSSSVLCYSCVCFSPPAGQHILSETSVAARKAISAHRHRVAVDTVWPAGAHDLLLAIVWPSPPIV